MLRHLSKLIGRANKKMMEVRLWNFFPLFRGGGDKLCGTMPIAIGTSKHFHKSKLNPYLPAALRNNDILTDESCKNK
jgi:hypothetical protein